MPSNRISHTEITENLLSTEHTPSSLLQKFEPVRRSSLKFFPEARYSSALSVEIFVKNFICCLPELQIISCRRQYLKQDFSKDLPMVCFVVTQHSESELSLCLRYSITSSLQAIQKHPRITRRTRRKIFVG